MGEEKAMKPGNGTDDGKRTGGSNRESKGEKRTGGSNRESKRENKGERYGGEDVTAAAGAGIYTPQELLQAFSWLARRYTSGESSSVPYETAQMLMEAVIYCLREYFAPAVRDNEAGDTGAGDTGAEDIEAGDTGAEDNEAGDTGAGPDVGVGRLPEVMTAYRSGYDKVVRKVYEAKAVYESLLEGFEDFGCLNYRDTVLKGMPAFFVRYDVRFCPQEHLLILDYPLLGGMPAGSGADLILRYLRQIRMEARTLSCFERQAVLRLLTGLMPDYEALYLDNLCEPVLLAAVLCFLEDRPVLAPSPDRRGLETAALLWKGLSGDGRTVKMKGWLQMIGRQISAAEAGLAGRTRPEQGGEQAVPEGNGEIAAFLERAAEPLTDRLNAAVKIFTANW